MDLEVFIILVQCFVLTAAYVTSLYFGKGNYDRNHPSTVKRRIISVTAMSIVAPFFTYLCLSPNVLSKYSFWELLGFRWSGLLTASTVPLVLTMILFLGPLALRFYQGEFKEIMSFHIDILWLRDHIVAPLSEELGFRSCMLPLLMQRLHPQMAVFVSSFFFGIAHVHHVIGRVKLGMNWKMAAYISAFQFTYSSLFGAYSAFLFLRTGHFMAPFVAHAFCNCHGFPEFGQFGSVTTLKGILSYALCVVSLILWCLLLVPLTNPSWYVNIEYWRSSVVSSYHGLCCNSKLYQGPYGTHYSTNRGR